MTHILAIDQGTSSSRAMLFGLDGSVRGYAQQEFATSYPEEGWVEQDPLEIWQSVLDTGREAIRQAGVPPDQILAIGVANQRETTLVWDGTTGNPIYPAIVWQDRRTAPYCAEIEAQGMTNAIAEATGLVIDPYFSSTKLQWILNQGQNRALAEGGDLRFGTVDSYLTWQLTKGSRHATDATNASRTQLFDIRRGQWSQTLCDYFDVPVNMLPEVQGSTGSFGTSDAEWFGAPIPITGVAGDQQAALIGQLCTQPGQSKVTFGTGCFLITNTGRDCIRSKTQLLSTIAYQVNDDVTYGLEGSIFNAGVAVKWLRSIGLIETASETEQCAQRIGGNTGGVYVVPAFTGLGAPHWRPEARGIVTGLSSESGRDEIVTATLKGIVFQLVDLLDAVRSDGIELSTLRVDGGMVANDWFCQFLADATGLDVERPRVVETTAVGAAALAAIGCGLAGSFEDLSQFRQVDRQFTPQMPDSQRTEELVGWRKAVNQAILTPK